MIESPRTFALRDPGASRDAAVVALGMTLPDGGAMTIDWRSGRPGAVGVWSSPHVAAAVHGAELVWYERGRSRPQPPRPPDWGSWRPAD
jgi:hypothetical protein